MSRRHEMPHFLALMPRLGRGVAWNFAATLFNQGTMFLISVVVARLLGRIAFGQYAMIQSTLFTLSTVAQLATGYTATKFLAEFRVRDKERAGRILALCFIVAGLMAVLTSAGMAIATPWLAAHALKAPELAAGLFLGVGVVLFAPLIGTQTGALVGLEEYQALARAGAFGGSLTLIVTCLLAWRFGLNGTVAGLSIGSLLQFGIVSLSLRKQLLRHGITLWRGGLLQERQIITKFAVPAALGGLVSIPALWLGNMLLVREPGGYPQMAIYGAATNVRVAALFLPNIINTVGLSLLNNIKGLGDAALYKKALRLNVTLVFLVAFTAAALLGAVGRSILTIFGKSFADGASVLVLMLLSTIPESIGIGLYQHVVSHSRMWLSLFLIAIPRDLTFCLLAYFLTAKYQADGLAVAYVLSRTYALGVTIACAAGISSQWELNKTESAKKLLPGSCTEEHRA